MVGAGDVECGAQAAVTGDICTVVAIQPTANRALVLVMDIIWQYGARPQASDKKDEEIGQSQVGV
jgi:hypothetical protein